MYLDMVEYLLPKVESFTIIRIIQYSLDSALHHYTSYYDSNESSHHDNYLECICPDDGFQTTLRRQRKYSVGIIIIISN